MKHLLLTLCIGMILGFIFIEQSFVLLIFSSILIYAISAQGLNIITGFTGQVSIGHAAFMAIGAYTAAYMSTVHSTPFSINLILAVFFSAAAGLLIGIPALRLKGFYLAIATLAFGIAIEQIISSVNALGGRIGIRGIPSLFNTEFDIFFLNLIFYAVLSFFTFKLINSPNGLKYQAIRDSEIASSSYGIKLSNYKLESFVISAIYGGIAGTLYAHTFGYISPQDFGLGISLNLLTMIVIGGMASVHGGLIGASIITGLPYLFSRSNFPMSLIFGVLLIIFVLFFPKGIIYGLYVLYLKYFEIPIFALFKKIQKTKKYPGEFIEIDGKKIFYNINGDGFPMIMIHGNFASHRWFQKVNDLEGYKVYSLDLPNFGRSDRIQNISIDDYASFVKSFMKKLKIEKAVVVGHSLGGAVAMSLSYNNPQMVEKLILVDSALVDGLKTPSENYTSLSLLKNNRSLLKNALTAIMPRVIDTKLLNELTNEALLMDKKCFTENARALESYNFTDISSNFKGETLFILGKFDNLITKSMAEKTCEVINAKLEYFDNLGHSIIVENPQLFKKVVYNFTKGE